MADKHSLKPIPLHRAHNIECSYVTRKRLLLSLIKACNRAYPVWLAVKMQFLKGWAEPDAIDIMEKGIHDHVPLSALQAKLDSAHAKKSKWCTCDVVKASKDQLVGGKPRNISYNLRVDQSAHGPGEDQGGYSSQDDSRFIPSIVLDTNPLLPQKSPRKVDPSVKIHEDEYISEQIP